MDFFFNISSNIRDLREISATLKEQQLVEDLDELSLKLKDNRFYLVIVGLFKRGKSSLINALIGEELAPVAVTPLTSVITFFEYAASTYSEVHFENESKITVNPVEIVQFVSEELNPNNRKEVKYIRVFTNSALLENVILVDTPGVGSVFIHNSETTFDFLPKIDAALFVLSADLPISKTDEDFLMQIKDSVSKVLFVMNKSDLLSNEELTKVTLYNQKTLCKILRLDLNQIELIPISAKSYLALHAGSEQEHSGYDGIENLREKIEAQIVDSKSEILILNTKKRVKEFAEHLITLLNVKFNSLQLPIHELEQKKEAMQSSIDYLNANLDDFQAIIKNRINQLQNKVDLLTNEKRVELISHCEKILVHDSEQTWLKIKGSDISTAQKELYDFIIKQFEILKDELEVSVKEEFKSILLQYSKQSQSFLNNIIVQMKSLLGVDIENIVSVFDLDVYSKFYFKEDIKYEISSTKDDFIQSLMPDSMVKRKMLHRIYINCTELINPNAGRIRADVVYKIDESFRKFKFYLDQKIYELLNSFKKIIVESIDAKSSTQKEIDEKLVEVRHMLSIVNTIKNRY